MNLPKPKPSVSLSAIAARTNARARTTVPATNKLQSEGTRKLPPARANEDTTPAVVSLTRRRERRRQPEETRAQMLERLTNPLISLHETSVLLRVCTATVRHYSNSNVLPHVRTTGGQRRFYLRDVLALLRQQEARRQKK